LKSKDTIAQAQSGTGKTATFAISILQVIDHNSPNCQALVLVPTFELAYQIERVIKSLGEYLKVSVHVYKGETSRGGGVINWWEFQVVVATSGKVNKMFTRGSTKSEYLKLFVLDEADEMLLRDFEINKIFQKIPRDIQVHQTYHFSFFLINFSFRLPCSQQHGQKKSLN